MLAISAVLELDLLRVNGRITNYCLQRLLNNVKLTMFFVC